ncbi:MAG: hypothetical protein LIP06_14140 [Tannerellaceae bacterium]|nr:hypothetical protein [Tannerellaceae bacterium]
MNKIKDILFPFIGIKSANDYIDNKLNEINNHYSFDVSNSTNKHEDIIELQRELKSQLERKKGIEDKAKSILFAITLTVTILIFSINSLKLSYNYWLDYLSLALLLFSVSCLIVSACLSLKALEVKEYNFLLTSKSDDETKKVELINDDEEATLINALKAKTLNDWRIIKISNYVSIAYSSIRNGIVGFAIVLIILMLHSFFCTC